MQYLSNKTRSWLYKEIPQWNIISIWTFDQCGCFSIQRFFHKNHFYRPTTQIPEILILTYVCYRNKCRERGGLMLLKFELCPSNSVPVPCDVCHSQWSSSDCDPVCKLIIIVLTDHFFVSLRGNSEINLFVHHKIMYILLLIFHYYYNKLKLLLLQEDWSVCPSECRCTWSGGKRTAECQVRQNIVEKNIFYKKY